MPRRRKKPAPARRPKGTAPRGRKPAPPPAASGRAPKKEARRTPASLGPSAPAAPPAGSLLSRAVRFFFGFVLLLATVTAVGAVAGGLYYYQKVGKELPDVGLLRAFRPSLVTRVFDRKGELIKEYFIERRFLIPFEEIPQDVIRATLATEDARFEEHQGVDLFGIVRAAWRNLVRQDIVEGGSTITQQLAKTLFLNPERSFLRKLREAILAMRIEKRFSKREILSLYLNQIYFGHGAYGIEAAARQYFGKRAKDLTLAESALLAGLPRAPSLYSPYKSLRLARRRRSHVLRRMEEEGYITKEERENAENTPIFLAKTASVADEAGYAVEYVRRRLKRRFGATGLYRDGLRVYTTIDRSIQRALSRAVRRGILAVDRRRGYRGPIGRVSLRASGERLWRRVGRVMGERAKWREIRSGQWEPAVVNRVRRDVARLLLREGPAVMRREDVLWARPFDPRRNGTGERLSNLRRVLRHGDVVLVERREAGDRPLAGPVAVALVQEPEVQAAAVVLEPRTGVIRGMVGGYDYRRSEFNRAVQAVRPPGSAFKPVTYSVAISEGWTPSDVIVDAPVIFPNEGKPGEWKPTNFENRFFGPTTLREALARSRNVVTVKLANALGVKAIVKRARLFGIRSPLKENLSIALGSNGVTLLELTSLYATLANLGRRVEPHMLLRVEAPSGKALWHATPDVRQTVPPAEAYVTLSLLKNVVEWGTGRKAKKLGRPTAGKTGTTNDYKDAWFIGVTPHYAIGVWVGMDDISTLGRGETGARAALPIWLEIAQEIHKGIPPADFRRPPKVEMAYIHPKTGVALEPDVPGGVIQAFLEGTVPPAGPRALVQKEKVRDLFREDKRAEAERGEKTSASEGEPAPPPPEDAAAPLPGRAGR